MSKYIPTTELKENPPYVDKLSDNLALNKMLNSHSEAIKAVQDVISDIENISEAIFKILKKNDKGRIIYAGAGTSIRIGVQDGVELYPTFGWPKSRTDFVIAGGYEALLAPIENAEDKFSYHRDLKPLKINKSDIIIGIAASGNTLFTLKTLEFCKLKGALTVGISNNPKSKMSKIADYNILLNTGREVVAGSTRLKAGTSQKICLNLISTMVMIKLGKVVDGEMINLVPTNKKLKKRLFRILNK